MIEELEDIFRDKGINFEANLPYYLCEIGAKRFHYSAKTGKWKMKGEQRKWFSSENVEDFIVQAQKYSPFCSKNLEQKPITFKKEIIQDNFCQVHFIPN